MTKVVTKESIVRDPSLSESEVIHSIKKPDNKSSSEHLISIGLTI